MSDHTFASNPFPGLRSFEYEDRNLFFGRDGHIRQIRDKLLENRFLALIGTSGSGKSSMIKAGLIPSLEKEETDNRWNVILFKPGARPVENLYLAITRQFGTPLPDSEIFNTASPEMLLDRIDAGMGLIEGQKVLLVIDQFEELFRYSSQSGAAPESSAGLFIAYLVRQIGLKIPVYIVITMRSDYLDHCTEFDGLTEIINKGNYLLPKMTVSEIHEVITRPVETAGARISDELVNQLMEETGRHPDLLPILQHALMRSWNRWRLTSTSEVPIGLTEYEAVGTIKEAITLHAEEIFQKLDDKRRDAAQKLFKTLITLGADDSPIVSPAPIAEIVRITGVPDYLLKDVISVFREEGVSFLTPKPNVKLSPDSVVDLTVERILALWTRCQKWMLEELESAKLYRQLSYSANLYQQGKSTLWVNPELQLGLNWQKENSPTLEWAKRYNPDFESAINFLKFSKVEADKEIALNEEKQKRELRRARFIASVLGISALVSLCFFIVAMVLRTQSKQNEKLALEKESLALSERNRAEEQTHEAVSQKKIAEQQGMLAELQRELTEEQKVIAVNEQLRALRESAAALEAKKVAEEQRSEAITARRQAENAQKETEEQRQVAVSARRESEKQRERAVSLQKDAEFARNDALRQRAQAIARFLAIQSAQLPDSDELAMLLALYAYELNIQNGGLSENPEIFKALSRVSGTKIARTGHQDVVRVEAMIYDGTSNWVASGSDDGEIRVWNLDNPEDTPLSLKKTGHIQESGIRALTFSDTPQTIIAGRTDGQLVLWHTNASKASSRVVTGHTAPVISLFTYKHREQTKLVSVDSGGQIRIWSLSGNITLLSTTNLDTPVTSSALSPDREYLFLGNQSGSLTRVSLKTAAPDPLRIPPVSSGFAISALAITPDRKQLFAGSVKGDILKVRLNDNLPVRQDRHLITGGHTSAIRRIAISRDGLRLATAAYDGRIRIYNLLEDIERQEPVTLDDFDFWVMDLSFTEDAKTLVATGADKTVRSWLINSENLYKGLKKKAIRNLTEEEWNKFIGKDIPYEAIRKTGNEDQGDRS